MKIILVRHAKVTLDESKKLKAHELKAWVERYDFSPIERQSLPNQRCRELLEEASFLVASERRRTIESLEQIGLKADLADEIFNEVEVANASFPFFRMRAKSHLMASRLLMLFPFGKPHRFLVVEKKRAKDACAYLEKLAHEHKSIALMGHGAINFLLSQELKKSAWKLVEQGGGNENWSYRVFEKEV